MVESAFMAASRACPMVLDEHRGVPQPAHRQAGEYMLLDPGALRAVTGLIGISNQRAFVRRPDALEIFWLNQLQRIAWHCSVGPAGRLTLRFLDGTTAELEVASHDAESAARLLHALATAARQQRASAPDLRAALRLLARRGAVTPVEARRIDERIEQLNGEG